MTAMFNVDYGTMQSSTSEGHIMMKNIDIVLKEFALKQIFNPFRFLMFWNAEIKQAKKSAIDLEKSQEKLLADYRSKKTKEEIANDPSILGHLVRSTYATDKERCADMTALMIGGHETTSHSLSWIMIEVSKHPDVLAKLKKEIGSIVTNDDNITMSQLSQMTYMDDVIKEGMRLWPVLALGPIRLASKDIQYGAYTIPKNSTIQMPFYVISRCGIQVSRVHQTMHFL
jgi:cytochrome P450